jgi:membrane-bound lytic murein transglycosylase A
MRSGILVLAGALLLAACAEHARAPKPVVTLSPPRPPPSAPAEASRAPPPSAPRVEPAPEPQPIAFAQLPGWAGEDHLAALAAVKTACAKAAAPDPAGVCLRLAWLDAPTDEQAREFLERNYRPVLLGEAGVLTGYFTPVYEARTTPDADFSAPVRPRPADERGGAAVKADRGRIDGWPADDALAWMKPEDLFFMQIQGSGVLAFADGTRLRAVFAGANDQPFVPIARPMRAQGLLGHDASGGTIHDWLASNRGPAAQAVMDLDPRYVFFRLQPDDGGPPAGAAGVRLIPGRALAVDPAAHQMGELLWIDAQAPALPGAFPVYQRLAVALDIGSAIKGDTRADLYLGEGEAAGQEAGRIRHTLHLYRLEPVGPPTP